MSESATGTPTVETTWHDCTVHNSPPFQTISLHLTPYIEAAHEEAEPAVHVPVQQQARAPPAAPEPTPMARLPSARVSTQVAKRRAEAEQPLMRPPAPDPDQSYEVELITGASMGFSNFSQTAPGRTGPRVTHARVVGREPDFGPPPLLPASPSLALTFPITCASVGSGGASRATCVGESRLSLTVELR